MGVLTEVYNLFRSPGGLQFGVVDPVTVASTTNMPPPKALISTVSGTTAIVLLPVPWPGFTGTIKYIPTAAFTGTTAGVATDTQKPFGLAFTAVIGKVLDLNFDGTKWYPSYTN